MRVWENVRDDGLTFHGALEYVKEEKGQVRDAIARLPVNYRVPLVLRYYSELSYDEIAEQLDLQRNYVAALIFRAKQELRRKLTHGSK